MNQADPPRPPRDPEDPRPDPAPKAAPAPREPAPVAERPAEGAQRVVVKFAEHLELPYDDTTEQALLDLDVGSVEVLRKDLPGLRLWPMFSSIEPAELRETLANDAARRPWLAPPRLMSLYYADADPGTDPEELAAAFRQWPRVERAYVQGPVGPAPSPAPPSGVTRFDELGPPNPDGPDQHHLDEAEEAAPGIGAGWAWTLPGGDGSEVQFADVEKGWNASHEDLADHFATETVPGSPVFGDSLEQRPHGTRALGVVAALDNAKHCIGVAPAVKRIVLSSRIVSGDKAPSGAYYDHTPEAIEAAWKELEPGDVILLETQAFEAGVDKADGVPCEIEEAIYEAIRYATEYKDLIVVEPTGNGNVDLDTLLDDEGKAVLDPDGADFRDSGAIMVASADPPKLTLRTNSCHGKRVDCFSWGYDVVTLSTDNAGSDDISTTSSFEDTSAAGAIVAGAAVVLQSIAKAAGFTLSPADVRYQLSRSDLNTPPDAADVGRMGYQPDLHRILKEGLGLAPDVYLRDHVGDTGDPHGDKISASPDVILRKDPVAGTPEATFGEGSGTEDDAKLGEAAEHGDTNHLYVRVRNRGGSPATGVQAKVYWSKPATLAMPALWETQVVGTTAPGVTVPMGDVLTLLPRLDWTDAPAPGHYCFIAEVDDPWDPAPAASTLTTLPAFKDHIRQYNNITWRNFNVVGPTGVPGGPSGPPGGPGPGLGGPGPGLGGPPAMGFPDPPAGAKLWALPFWAVGAADDAYEMQLEIISNLPAHMHVGVEMPMGLYVELGEARPGDITDPARGRAIARMPTFGTHVVLDGLWKARLRHECHLVMMLLQGDSVGAARVALRQVFEGVEVGRVTWVTRPTSA